VYKEQRGIRAQNKRPRPLCEARGVGPSCRGSAALHAQGSERLRGDADGVIALIVLLPVRPLVAAAAPPLEHLGFGGCRGSLAVGPHRGRLLIGRRRLLEHGVVGNGDGAEDRAHVRHPVEVKKGRQQVHELL